MDLTMLLFSTFENIKMKEKYIKWKYTRVLHLKVQENSTIQDNIQNVTNLFTNRNEQQTQDLEQSKGSAFLTSEFNGCSKVENVNNNNNQYTYAVALLNDSTDIDISSEWITAATSAGTTAISTETRVTNINNGNSNSSSGSNQDSNNINRNTNWRVCLKTMPEKK